MRIYNSWLLTLLGMVFTLSLQAHIGPTRQGASSNDTPSSQVNFRESCSDAVTQIEQDINNVRARLLTGGDVWWDGGDGRYVVPKPPPGVPEVSSIYAGAVWIGGKDPGGNLKVAAQSYGRNEGNFDFYPGPLYEGDPDYPEGQINDPRRGTIGQDTCAKWDKFFVVEGANIDKHVANWRQALASGQSFLDPDEISEDILGWPGRGNRFFEGIHQFQLPLTQQGLAGFWDQDGDGNYEPDEGDYPIIEIRGCLDVEPKSAPDQMIYWVYNDAGNTHDETDSETPLKMEIQVQAFAYKTNDDINSMTFQRYKLINRAIERLDSTYFAMWIDPDLGCSNDDYVGCDVDRSLAYVYNSDQVDGAGDCSCEGGVNTYCNEIPILGIDYFRGPIAPIYDNSDPPIQIGEEELGMSSFTYANRADANGPAPQTTDPETASEYYNYLSGKWRDGSPLTFGGDGFQTGGEPTSYAFFDPPNMEGGWSMCQEDLATSDRRTLQASGQFTLLPGAVNELIIGVVWVPDQVYPCPSISRLQKADDIAQSLFDNCFDITRGPDAPDVDWIELDRELVAVFSNDTLVSNNAFEKYQERGLGIPRGEDTLYRFEGYKVYQFSGPSVSLVDVDDPEKVRLVYQVDKTNGIEKIFNWEGLSSEDNQTPTEDIYYTPELKVNGANDGIRHTFSIKEDQFGESDRRLVNHRKYYFTAVAYGYNNYKEFDPAAEGDQGQQTPYLEGDRNIGDGDNSFYTVIPRKILDRQLQASYGDGPVITRIDGAGTGSNFLDISDETRTEIEKAILDNDPSLFSNEVTYKGGFGPIDVTIFNPLEVQDGEYELTFVDDDLGNDQLDAPTHWTLRNLTNPSAPVIVSDASIAELNEQIIREYGFSVTIAQVDEPGADPFVNKANGAIGYTEEYLNPEATPWLFGVPDNLSVTTGNALLDGAIFDYIATSNSTDIDYEHDPNRALSDMGSNEGIFVPYYLCNWRSRTDGQPYLSPAWQNSGNQNNIVRNRTSLEDLNNIDIVFTSNKDLWSRCVVIETANPALKEIISATPEDEYVEGNADMFDLRAHVSVSKEAGPDGLPLPDTNAPAGEEDGMGWFPGYAIDVETGVRLNVFFGENSVYNGSVAGASDVGADMMFNPTSEFFFQSTTGQGESILNFPMGGQHYVYVTNQPYDRCAQQLDRFGGSSDIQKIAPLESVVWAGLVIPPPGGVMNSYADGLIPSDVIAKIRVTNPYQVKTGTGEFNGYPTYRFTLEGKQALALDDIATETSLQSINIVPNPYYGFSEYEDSQFETVVKISNLPAQCTVSIYSLDGKFIRTYERNEVGQIPGSPNRAIERAQITPDLEWELKNFKGIPIASGVYLNHVSAPGYGERTLKWFGVNRQFDPSGL